MKAKTKIKRTLRKALQADEPDAKHLLACISLMYSEINRALDTYNEKVPDECFRILDGVSDAISEGLK